MKQDQFQKLIAKSKLPKASTYNRIRELIQDGLLTMVGFTKASDGRKVNEYATTFSRTVFEIQDKDIFINANVQKNSLETVLHLIQFTK